MENPNYSPLISDINETESIEINKKKSGRVFEKYLGDISGLGGPIFSLSAMTIGTGCFALPNRCAELGLINEIILLLLGAYCAYWALGAMIHASRNSSHKDYSLLVKESLGKIPGLILDVFILIFIFGILISYQVVIYSLIGRVYFELFKGKNGPSFVHFEKVTWDSAIIKFPIMFGVSFLILPLCLLKDLSKMSFTSIIGICALAYTILVITFQCPLFYNNFKTKVYDINNPKTHPNFFSLAPSLRADMNIFQCIATIFFCYACHIGAFPVYKSLKNPTHKRINIVYIGSLLLDFIIYFLVSVCGFLTAPIKQPSLIIYRENNNVIQNDIFMIVAKLSICVCLSMAIPPNYNSFRISFMTLFFGTSEISDKTNYILTLSVIGFSTFIGAVYNDILKFISLLGGFIGVVIAFLMPGLLYIKNNQYNLTNCRNICSLLFICSLCTIGFIAGIETILF